MCKLISASVPMFPRTNSKKMFLTWYKNYKGGHMIYPQSFKVSLMHTNFVTRSQKNLMFLLVNFLRYYILLLPAPTREKFFCQKCAQHTEGNFGGNAQWLARGALALPTLTPGRPPCLP